MRQTERAKDQGISRRTQQKYDYVARVAPDLYIEVQKGKLTISAAERIARGSPA